MPGSLPTSELLAHGVGGRSDLPVPADYVLVAAAVALLVSFAVLAFAWRAPRFRGDDSGRLLPGWFAAVFDSPITRGIVVAAALLFAAWVTMAAVFGADSLVNPTFGTVYVLLWVGLAPAALLFGRIYRLCNPLRWLFRGITKLGGGDPSRGVLRYPTSLGYWPAAALLFAFVWLELVHPATTLDLTAVRLWFAVVASVLLVGAAVYGDTFFAHADPFEVYSSLVARLSPFGRRTDGALVVRNPLENLDGQPAVPGLVGVVAVLFGSTAFDSFKDSSRWLNFSQQHSAHPMLLNTAALLGFCLAVLVSFAIASVATAGIGHLERRRLPALMAHSVVPIVVGYVVAHYLSYFLVVGTTTVQQLGDPLSRGWTLTSWAYGVNKYAIYDHPTALAVTKVVAVITGHVLGVIAAHDRTVRLLPRRHAVTGQLPMFVLMVGYTITGLWLLFYS